MSPVERSAGGGGGGFTNPMTTKGDIIIESAVPAPDRLAIGTTGQALAVASGLPAWATPSGFEFDYVQITANVSVTNSGGTFTTVITGNSVPYDGATRIRVDFYSPVIEAAAAVGAFVAIELFDGATDLCEIVGTNNPSSGGAIDLPCFTSIFLTPTNGAHQYIVKATRQGNGTSPTNGLVAAGTGTAGGFAPAFLRVTKA